MSVGLVVLAHGPTVHLHRLLDRVVPHSAGVAVHYDARSPDESFEGLRDRRDVLLTERRPTRHSGWSLVDATIRSLRVLLSATPCEYVFLLSGSDYPIQSWPEIERAAADGRPRLDLFPLPDPRWPNGGLDRIWYWRLTERARAQRLNRTVRRLQERTGWLRRPVLPPYGGTQWWGLPRDCIEETVLGPEAAALARFYRWTLIPDEMYVQTAVGNTRWGDDVLREPTYMHWSEGTSPAVLTEAHLPLLLGAPQLFARKFDERSGPLLAHLDRLLDEGAPEPE